MPRLAHCGKYQRTPEIIERQRARLLAFWADPEIRRIHGDLTRKRMARPSEKTKAAKACRDVSVRCVSIDQADKLQACSDRSGSAP
jgi:hypothetical protein